MMKAKLIIAGEERWLTNFHYEYFFPIENNPDFDGGRLPLSDSADNEWFFKPVQFRPVETFDTLIRPNDGIDGPIRHQMAGGLSI